MSAVLGDLATGKIGKSWVQGLEHVRIEKDEQDCDMNEMARNLNQGRDLIGSYTIFPDTCFIMGIKQRSLSQRNSQRGKESFHGEVELILSEIKKTTGEEKKEL